MNWLSKLGLQLAIILFFLFLITRFVWQLKCLLKFPAAQDGILNFKCILNSKNTPKPKDICVFHILQRKGSNPHVWEEPVDTKKKQNKNKIICFVANSFFLSVYKSIIFTFVFKFIYNNTKLYFNNRHLNIRLSFLLLWLHYNSWVINQCFSWLLVHVNSFNTYSYCSLCWAKAIWDSASSQ